MVRLLASHTLQALLLLQVLDYDFRIGRPTQLGASRGPPTSVTAGLTTLDLSPGTKEDTPPPVTINESSSIQVQKSPLYSGLSDDFAIHPR